MSLGTSVEEEDSPLVFLEKVHLLRERVEDFTKAPLPLVLGLSVTPRAAEYLQQNWPAVTIGSLENAPVPKVCCCARCGSMGMETAAERKTQSDCVVRDVWHQLQPMSMLLLGLLLLLVAVLCADPVGGASLGFSLLSRFSQLVHSLSGELMTSAWDSAGMLYTELQAALESWSVDFSWVGEKAFQQLTALFQTLTS